LYLTVTLSSILWFTNNKGAGKWRCCHIFWLHDRWIVQGWNKEKSGSTVYNLRPAYNIESINVVSKSEEQAK